VQIGEPLEEAEVALPEIGPSEVLVRVEACGICHSDAHYRAGISPIDRLPLTLGHEVAGRVEAAGDEVTHVSPNDRVMCTTWSPVAAVVTASAVTSSSASKGK
jgi:propanol-preferring alcohol dehydrogenase